MGTLLRNLVKKEGVFACGCDSSLGMLSVFKKDTSFEKICADCQQLPFPDNAFDLVISVAVFHHLNLDQVVANALKEMIRVTRKNGKIVVWDANNLNPYWLFLFKMVSYDKDVERPVKLKKIILEAEKNNVSSIRIIKSGWVPDFAPKILMPFFETAERVLEALPVVNLFSAHNIIILNK